MPDRVQSRCGGPGSQCRICLTVQVSSCHNIEHKRATFNFDSVTNCNERYYIGDEFVLDITMYIKLQMSHNKQNFEFVHFRVHGRYRLLFTPHHVGHCCTNVIRGHCRATTWLKTVSSSNCRNSEIQGHCAQRHCATM
jgi:hypothetical protein